jgi:hypothetical protein
MKPNVVDIASLLEKASMQEFRKQNSSSGTMAAALATGSQHKATVTATRQPLLATSSSSPADAGSSRCGDVFKASSVGWVV